MLLIDYGLTEKTIQGICHGLDQLFSIVTTYIGIQHLPMFGLIVNGQNQSEVGRFLITPLRVVLKIFLSLSPTSMNHMELQIALYKLQLLAQKWSSKTVVSSSWHSTFQLASIEINNHKTHVSLRH